MKKGSKALLISLISSSVALLSLGAAGITYANYKTAASVTQQAGYQGKLNQTSIFLNANIWEVDNAIFYMFDNREGKWHLPEKTIHPTIGGTTFTLYVYIMNGIIESGANIVFARVNPNGSHVPVDGGNTAWDFTDTVWNQTDNIQYAQMYENSKYYNYYCVTGWETGTGYHNNDTEKNSGYEKNVLTTNAGGSLVWG